jgi:thiamine kinase-like enzyme
MAKQIVEADRPQVAALLDKVLGRSDYAGLERMGGLTNRTYKVTFADGARYVVRIPGEGTEDMIVRSDEKISTELACRLGIDAQLLYFGTDGAKVTAFIPDAQTMSADTLKAEKRIRQAAALLKTLHTCGTDTGVPFEVFDMAAGYEKIIADKHVPMFADYDAVKATVMQIKKEVDARCTIRNVPCHNDPLCENWVVSGTDDRMYLIDWEYAGMNDGIWDLADLSIEAAYDAGQDAALLTAYLGKAPGQDDLKHFLANKLYVDYLWTLWAKTRVPYDGQPMEDWAAERYARLKANIDVFRAV